jgi:hypothetical protein
MSNDEIDHGNGFFSEPFAPPLTNTEFYSELDDYTQRICRRPVSLPGGSRTVQVSERYRIPWAAEPEDRTREAIIKVRKMTEEDMEQFKEDLEKSAVNWIEAQKGEATGGENDIIIWSIMMLTTIIYPTFKLSTLYGDVDTNKCYIDRISTRYPFPTPRSIYDLRGLASWRSRLNQAEDRLFDTDLFAAIMRFNNGEDCGTPPSLPPGYYTPSISAELDFPWNPGGCEYMKNSYQRLCEMKSGSERTAFDEALMEDAVDWARSRERILVGLEISKRLNRAESETVKTGTRLSAMENTDQSAATENVSGSRVESDINLINDPGDRGSWNRRGSESRTMTQQDRSRQTDSSETVL